MKHTIIFLISITIICSTLFGQKFGKGEVNYSDPFQIDSSEYFLIPKLVNKDDKVSFGKGYLPLIITATYFFTTQ